MPQVLGGKRHLHGAQAGQWLGINRLDRSKVIRLDRTQHDAVRSRLVVLGTHIFLLLNFAECRQEFSDPGSRFGYQTRTGLSSPPLGKN